jgi:hypothetical protein
MPLANGRDNQFAILRVVLNVFVFDTELYGFITVAGQACR